MNKTTRNYTQTYKSYKSKSYTQDSQIWQVGMHIIIKAIKLDTTSIEHLIEGRIRQQRFG